MIDRPGLESRVAAAFEKSAPAIVLASILLTIVSGLALSPMPEFQTDLDAFAPESDADAAVERMDEVMPPSPHRIYVHICLLYTSPSPRDRQKSRMPSSA